MWKEEDDMFVLMRMDCDVQYLSSQSSCMNGGWFWTGSLDRARKFLTMHELLYFIAQSAQTYDGHGPLQGQQVEVVRVKKEMKVVYNVTPL